MTLLDEEEAQLLLQARREFTPGLDQAERVRAAVLGSIVLPAALGETVASGSKASIGAGAAGGSKLGALGALGAKTWLAAVALGLGISSGVGWWALRSSEPAPTSSTSVEAPRASVEPAPLPSAEPPPVPREPERVAPPSAPTAKAGLAARPRLELREELLSVRDAERALNTGNAARALTILDELGRLPGGNLGEERAALRVLAHCQLGGAQSRERAQRFLLTHGSSVYAPRVRAACASGTSER